MADFRADKPTHSTFSNIFYFLKLLFKISPLLVIGECFWGVLMRLPTRLISVLGVKYVIDVIASGDDKMKIVRAVIVIAIVLILSEVLNALYREFFFTVELEKISKGLSEMLFKKAKDLDLSSYDDPDFYNNFILVINSSGTRVTMVLGLVQRYIGEVVSLITIGSILLTIDPICLLIVLVVVAVFTPVSRKIGKLQAQRQIDNNRLHRRADYFARVFYLQDYCKEVRMNDIKPLLLERYNEAADDVIKNQIKYVRKIDFIYFFQESGVQILGFMLLLPLYLGYCVLQKHTLSAGDFVATFNGALQIATSFSFLTVGVVRQFSESARLIEKYREFLKRPKKIEDGEGVAENGEPKTVELKNVSFTYPGNDHPTLKNINMTIHPKEKIALVGYNGAGKTTLTNLLLRLYDVSDGQILIDGEDIRDVTLQSHRDRFSAVFQDFQVFAATLGENVALDTDVNPERAREALRHSGFSKKVDNGLDAYLLREFDDDGVMMSGGESQKVAISRAFYKKCPYVILDEPSANLDPVAEYNLNQSMIEAAQDKTVVFISHRLSTTVSADRIYVMENGEIIEEGSHDELMARGGTYAYMFNLQAEKYK
ncbi:MAG: ABC transporter ATP-binding protein [Ruminococcaceae bacterium]|nr:ABC transporter ATP-binding protein [Oscillospiraceae bacterium]